MASSKIVLTAFVVFVSAFATAAEEVESQFRRPPLPRPRPCDLDRCTAQCRSRGCQVGVCQAPTIRPLPLGQDCRCQQCQKPADENVLLDEKDGPKPTTFQPCDASQCQSQCKSRGCSTGVCRIMSLRPDVSPSLLCKCQQCIEPRPANEEEAVPLLVGGQPVPVGFCKPEECTSGCRSRGCEIGVCQRISLRPVSPNQLCRCQQCASPSPKSADVAQSAFVRPRFCRDEICAKMCQSQKGCVNGYCKQLGFGPHRVCDCEGCDF